MEREGMNSTDKTSTSGEDARDGLVAIVSDKVPDPKFSSQTQDHIVSPEFRPVVEQKTSKDHYESLSENPAQAH